MGEGGKRRTPMNEDEDDLSFTFTT
jgi:hypothetical protein